MTIEPKLMSAEQLAEVTARHAFFRIGDTEAVWCILLLAHAAAQAVEVAQRDRAIEAMTARIAEMMDQVEHLGRRQAEHLKLIARISQETPLADEVAGWQEQRAAMIAEVGTQRARSTELETALHAACDLIEGIVTCETKFPMREHDPDWKAAQAWRALAGER